MLDELLQRESANGRTILMITHDLVHGLDLCDRVAILSRGKIACDLNSGDISAAEFLELYAQHTGRKKESA